MNGMTLLTESRNSQLWAGTDLATATYSVTIAPCRDTDSGAPIASATRAVLDRRSGAPGSPVSNYLRCFPLADANNATITGFRVYGWDHTRNRSTGVGVWTPYLLFEMAGTAGNIAFPTTGGIGSYYGFDTLTMVNPASAPNYLEVFSPVSVTADLPGWFRFDAMGFPRVEVVVDLGTASAFNILVTEF